MNIYYWENIICELHGNNVRILTIYNFCMHEQMNTQYNNFYVCEV